MEFSVLGPVLVDGRSPPGAIERALLARLLVDPGAPVPSEELIAAGWPDARRSSAAASLRVRLARLRAFLEPDRAPGTPGRLLIRDPAGYRLAVAPACVDAGRFRELAGDARSVEDCDRALALWRGEPFADLDGDEAARTQARRLHALRDAVRRRRAGGLAEAGRLDEAVAELRVLIAEAPLHEEPVRELMLALYRAGRHAEALDAYRELARRLDEVGLQPSPASRELEALVLRHELAAPSNLGAPVASIVGRDEDLARVHAALDEHRIVTLVGPGGVGKTTLAAETGRSRAPGGGTWLVELEPLPACEDVLPAVATALGLRRVGDGGGDALAVVRERLERAETLLVLDGGEHLVPGLGPVVRELVSTVPLLRVLVTSRRPLGVPGEAVIPVPALAEAAARRLFEERAEAACPGWRGDPVAVEAICRRLDGLPLALELAAGRLRALSARAIADRLEEGIAVLGRGTLDASIEASHALLGPAERELYRRLSIFASTFELEDAEAVAAGDGLARGDVLEALVALVEHSMIHPEGEAPRRYRLLEALRADARSRLDATTAQATARRHTAHLARVAAAAADLVRVDGAEAAGDPLIPRRPDLEVAFADALRRRDADAALGLAAGLEAMHHRLGTVALAVECGERALALGGGSPERRLIALTWHCAMLLAELRVDDARFALEQARAVQDDVYAPGLRVLAAQVALCAGELDRAEASLSGVLELLVERGEWFNAAVAAHTLGGIAAARGDAAAAIVGFREACGHYARCGDVCSLDGAAADLAQVAAAAGREDDAAVACADALEAAPERPLGERGTHLLHEAALAAARAGRLEDAARLASAAAVAAGRDPVVIGPWHAPAAAGDVALLGGDAGTAQPRYAEARRLASRIADERGRSLPTALYLVASELRLADSADDPAAALAHARTALAHARDGGVPAGVGAAQAVVERLEAAITAR